MSHSTPQAVLRDATPEDAADFFKLLVVSDSEFMPSVFGRSFERAATRLFMARDNIFSHAHTRFCVVDGRIAGMCYRFESAARDQLATRTGLLLLRAMGLDMLRQFPSLLVSDRLLGTPPPHTCYLSNLAVYAEFQGRGLGALLMRDAESLATQAGLNEMLLDVRAHNAQATAVYVKGGYRHGEVRTLHVQGKAFEYLRMSKPLGC